MSHHPDQSSLDTLANDRATLAELMSALSALDRSESGWRPLKLGIAANVTVDLLAMHLRRRAYLAGIRLQVNKGSYDDVVGDLQAFRRDGVDLVLILPFFDNLQPSWETRLALLTPEARQAVQQDQLARLDLALQAGAGISQILLLGPHVSQPRSPVAPEAEEALQAFEQGLLELTHKHAGTRLLETQSLFTQMGAGQALDARFYHRAKSPYTSAFLDTLAQHVAMSTRQFGTRFHKVLVLDCDNTLWGGVIGEDGLAGIQLDPNNYPGNVFHRVQQYLSALESKGVLLCLCSKNNEADVTEAFTHQAMVLKTSQVVAKQVNWQDKPSNLRALAAQLNLGLDSFVFLDDSAFEVQAMRDQLPQVTTFQVPTALHDYPALLRERIAPLFLAGQSSQESQLKTRQYQALAQAAELRAQFSSQEEYLRSLQLAIRVQRNARAQAPRIAELIAKSNQFNLTTRRLSQAEVLAWMDRSDAMVYSFSVQDRLADHGLTGVLITQDDGESVVVHSFLMSCRVIGRGVEFAIWQSVIQDALARGKKRLTALYQPSPKNALVADFYDRLGLQVETILENGGRQYQISLPTQALTQSDWIETHDD